jgi:lipoprotein NlpI
MHQARTYRGMRLERARGRVKWWTPSDIMGVTARVVFWDSALLTICLFSACLPSAAAADAVDDTRKALATLKADNAAGAISLFTRALQSNELSPRNQAVVLNLRGTAWHRSGSYEEAVTDYSHALALQPDYAVALNNRALAYHEMGRDEAALSDYDQALQLGTTTYRTYFGRGVLKFDEGNFRGAATDFLDSLRLNPSRVYSALWYYLATYRAGKPDASLLIRFAAEQGSEDRDWPRPVAGLYLGRTSPEQVRSAAESGGPTDQRDHYCEANFYIGELEIQKGNAEAAKNLFLMSQEHCPLDFYEYYTSKVELSRLKKCGGSDRPFC